MNSTDVVLEVISCMSANAPVFRYWGYGLGCPICLVLTDGLELEPILAYWNAKDRLITPSTPARVYHRIIGEGNHFPVLLFYGEVTTAEISTRFKELEEAEITGRSREGSFRATAVVVAKDNVPEAICERVFPVYIRESPNGKVNYSALVPDQKDLPHIMSLVTQFTDDTPVERYFRCVLQFLNFSLLNHEYDRYCDYENEVTGIINDFYEGKDPGIVEERFIDSLFKWAKEHAFHELYEVRDVTSINDINDIMIYDRCYLYIGTSVFGEISDEMHFTSDRLKRLLASTNPPVLVRQEKGCFTCKVPIAIDGYARPRMLRFDLARINRGRGGENISKGLLTFETMCQRRK